MSADLALELEDVVFRYQEKGRRNILDHTSLTIPGWDAYSPDGRQRLPEKARWLQWPQDSTLRTAAFWKAASSGCTGRI